MNTRRLLLALISLPILVSIGGCFSVPPDHSQSILATVLAYMPNGSTKALDINVTTPIGTATITGTNVVKTDAQVTAETLQIDLVGTLGNGFHYKSEGFSPVGGTPQPVTIVLAQIPKTGTGP